MNLADIRELFWTYTLDRAGRRLPPQVVLRLINRGLVFVATKMGRKGEHYVSRAQNYSVTSTAQDLEFDLPADFDSYRLAEKVPATGRPTPAVFVNFEDRLAWRADSASAVEDRRPVVYIRGSKLGVVQPGGSYTLRLWYTSTSTDLVEDGDTPEGIPEKHHNLIALHAAKLALGSVGRSFSAGLQEVYTDEVRELALSDRHEATTYVRTTTQPY